MFICSIRLSLQFFLMQNHELHEELTDVHCACGYFKPSAKPESLKSFVSHSLKFTLEEIRLNPSRISCFKFIFIFGEEDNDELMWKTENLNLSTYLKQFTFGIIKKDFHIPVAWCMREKKWHQCLT